jgi:peptidoglycan/LPS O-acetylase OafA/YrhL
MAALDSAFARVASSPARMLVFPAIAFLTLLPMENAWLDDPSGFVPEAKIFIAYLVPFAAGWLLFRNRKVLDALRRGAPVASALTAGVLAFGLAFACFFELRDPAGRVTRLGFLGCEAFHAIAMWGFIFGFTGLFLRYLERPIGWLRYVSDSSYWLYLAHMPVLMAFQIALARTGWPPVVKIAAVLAASVPVLLASYHFLVRPTVIGAVLNGRRYPVRPGWMAIRSERADRPFPG